MYVALLRAVNVGGRTVPMAGLRELWATLGFSGVRTYLQSGNVVFGAERRPDPTMLADAIEERFGVTTAVVLRSGAELARVLAANPFPRAGGTILHVAFLLDMPRTAGEEIDDGRYAPEEAVLIGREVYFHLPDGIGRAKLPPYVGRRLGTVATVRNWRTVEALTELAAEGTSGSG